MAHDTDSGEPRFGEGSYDSTAFGGPEQPLESSRKTWRINNTRIDFFLEPPSTVTPGEGATYSCVLVPGAGITDLQTRYETLRRYARNGPFITTWQTQGECHYREQHDDPDGSQLVYIAPLDGAHDAVGTPENPPPERDSPFESRYAVVTGVSQSATNLPRAWVQLDIETTTVARGSAFATREDCRDAREHNGFR